MSSGWSRFVQKSVTRNNTIVSSHSKERGRKELWGRLASFFFSFLLVAVRNLVSSPLSFLPELNKDSRINSPTFPRPHFLPIYLIDSFFPTPTYRDRGSQHTFPHASASFFVAKSVHIDPLLCCVGLRFVPATQLGQNSCCPGRSLNLVELSGIENSMSPKTWVRGILEDSPFRLHFLQSARRKRKKAKKGKKERTSDFCRRSATQSVT
jgi:hypothetical protein